MKEHNLVKLSTFRVIIPATLDKCLSPVGYRFPCIQISLAFKLRERTVAVSDNVKFRGKTYVALILTEVVFVHVRVTLERLACHQHN